MTKGLGFRISGLGFGVQSVGFEVHVVKGLGFQVTGIESRMLIPWLLEICTTQLTPLLRETTIYRCTIS